MQVTKNQDTANKLLKPNASHQTQGTAHRLIKPKPLLYIKISQSHFYIYNTAEVCPALSQIASAKESSHAFLISQKNNRRLIL
jgi:hypothetical protein